MVHRDAMESAVTGKEGTAINDFHLPVREQGPEPFHGNGILGRIGSRNEHSAVYDEEIGVGCRETVVVQIHGIRQRKRDKPIRPAFQGAESL